MKDSKTDKPSPTTTVFVVGSIICLLKLLFSDITIWGFHIPVFGGTEFGIALAAVGSVYILHKNNERKNENTKSEGQ